MAFLQAVESPYEVSFHWLVEIDLSNHVIVMIYCSPD